MIKQTFKMKGRLVYDPQRPGMKKAHRAGPGWLILTFDPELGRFYRFLLKQFTGYIVQGQTYELHVTVVNDRDPDVSNHELWRKYHGKSIEVEIDVRMEQHWRFFVLPVISKDLEAIRSELGLDTKKHPFHLTIGRA
jgi:hypothetical protein